MLDLKITNNLIYKLNRLLLENNSDYIIVGKSEAEVIPDAPVVTESIIEIKRHSMDSSTYVSKLREITYNDFELWESQKELVVETFDQRVSTNLLRYILFATDSYQDSYKIKGYDGSEVCKHVSWNTMINTKFKGYDN